LLRWSSTADFLRPHAQSALRKHALAGVSRHWRNGWVSVYCNALLGLWLSQKPDSASLNDV
jgi:hypothetical protein